MNDLEIKEWNDTKIIAVAESICRQDYWIIDFIDKKVRFESVYKSPEQQQGNCDGLDTDVRKARLGNFDEARLKWKAR